MSKKSVVIIGGYGTFGKLIADQLIEKAEIKIAGRSRSAGQAFADSIGAEFVFCDTSDEESLKNAVAGAYLVINASGPFYAEDYSIPRICIEQGCHFIDIADGRDFFAGFEELDAFAKQKNVFACTGASTTPAVTSALIRELLPSMGKLESIHVYLSVGNRNKPGLATLESILSYVGTPIKVWKNNQWQGLSAWSMPEYFNFPAPVGKRRVQLCNVPDLEIIPKIFDAQEVIFKAGVELSIFNIALSIFAFLKRIFPAFRVQRLGRILLWIAGLFEPFGTYAGGITVRLKDVNGIVKFASFATAQNGRRIPSSPAVLLARKVLKDGPPSSGAFPCVGYITCNEFKEFLAPFGIKYES